MWRFMLGLWYDIPLMLLMAWLAYVWMAGRPSASHRWCTLGTCLLISVVIWSVGTARHLRVFGTCAPWYLVIGAVVCGVIGLMRGEQKAWALALAIVPATSAALTVCGWVLGMRAFT